MQLWFWAAVISAIASGFGNFLFKVAAKRNYSGEMFSLYGGLVSVAVSIPLSLLVSGTDINWFAASVGIVAGIIAATAGIAKIYALRHIDTTIFFPLYKLVSPLLAIVFGLIFFGERFGSFEWFGMALGLLVPLLLISRAEQGRQSNLVTGLTLLFIGAVISATAAAFNKYSVDLWNDTWWLLSFVGLGVFIGSVLSLWWKSSMKTIITTARTETSLAVFGFAALRAIIMCVALWMGLYAFGHGGTLAVVHTIQSMYILIPIVLSIIFYNEHWNAQKVVAIMLSVAALSFLH